MLLILLLLLKALQATLTLSKIYCNHLSAFVTDKHFH